MILTITMNPSVDISYSFESFSEDTVNRVDKVRKTAGGKGLNVTRVLNQLGAEVSASGLLGGFLGEQIRSELDESGINHSFTQISGETRNCIAILHEGRQTEILEKGPTITEEEATLFLEEFKRTLRSADLAVFSGSLPAGIEKNFYVNILEICAAQGKPVVLDCAGDPLKTVLASPIKPLLIKPNTEELSDLLGVEETNDPNKVKQMLKNSIFKGVEWIIVSMGAKGMVAKHHEIFYDVTIPKIDVVNPVGSGDATVSGLAYALSKHKDDETILKTANTLGMLNAKEPTTGYVNLSNFDQLFETIEVKIF
ncbi:tagatose-6-phosphate kinase [Enterococcus sp. DIV1298c]|uniref:tagatose-6-phosphate kinase n=1 Tax=Enterococcus sp. DIV1298c TaxID=2815328 RepID=UPI001A917F9C|nr:tagatose-6-phosphate kinase [Enterococcus sp. DIV1298c]MBO0462585.1 tagatose-6-phosphate kinase [Enterococcus sp. DIV1298c]